MTVINAKSALLPNGWATDVGITISEGRIAEVGALSENGMAVDVLLPAPVNLHSHAFQRAMAGLTERRGEQASDSFWTWRQLMFRFLDQLTPDDVQAIAAQVQMEMLEAGFGASVEFHYLHHQPGGAAYANRAEMSERIVAAAAQTGIGLTLLPVLYSQGGVDGRALGPGQVRFGNDMDGYMTLMDGAQRAVEGLSEDARIGIAPHSLRAVTRSELMHLQQYRGPIHMHLAEQEAEVDEVKAAYGARPVTWVLDHLDLGANWCFVHCTQMTRAETRGLAQSGVVAGLCPITESSLGDGIFNGRDWIDAGGVIGLGSDSNILISLTQELRTLEYSQRLRDKERAIFAQADKSTGRTLFDHICAGGAQAAGRESGTIAKGAWADLLALRGDHTDFVARREDTVLDSWIFANSSPAVAHVWSAGRHVVKHGRHIEREAITGVYRATLLRLKDVM
ncbi:MAG: formimidoylglutamate deiminase [Pseudomonadota bacterium]